MGAGGCVGAGAGVRHTGPNWVPGHLEKPNKPQYLMSAMGLRNLQINDQIVAMDCSSQQMLLRQIKILLNKGSPIKGPTTIYKGSETPHIIVFLR